MITKTEIMKYIEEKYNSLPEYIFEKFPNYCVFRHTRGKNGFA